MRPKALLAVFPAAVALLLATPNGAQTSSSQADHAVRERGKQVFTTHCGKCHDADAAKPLPDGTTLLGRLAANKDPNARLATRLKSMPEQDGQALVFYVDDLIAQFQTAQNRGKAK